MAAPGTRFPPWLKKRLPQGRRLNEVSHLLDDLRLHTVCRGAHCPNLGECYERGTATFMILGDTCTRHCRFCAVHHASTGSACGKLDFGEHCRAVEPHSQPQPLDPDEPRRVAEAARRLALQYVVITSVTRDDLPDGGAAHFAATINAIRSIHPLSLPGRGQGEGSPPVHSVHSIHSVHTVHSVHSVHPRTEVLTPDFQGHPAAIDTVLAAQPTVYNHNVETVPRLYPQVRPEADYRRSLDLLRRVAQAGTSIAKSGLMVGLGETDGEILALFDDLADAGCQMLTIGQYLQPSPDHLPVQRFVEPDRFDSLRTEGLRRGIRWIAAGPFVRSSYRAEDAFASASNTTEAQQQCSKMS